MREVKTNNRSICNAVLSTLTEVYDPEIGLNIVDLGLILEVNTKGKFKINLIMTLTTRFCPMGESIVEAVYERMKNSFPSYSTHVDLDFEMGWNADQVSEAGKKMLNGN